MKKLLSLALVFLITIVPVSGETLDFKSMSLEELAKIKAEIDFEIASRAGDDWEIVSSGKYAAGVDVQPGRYEFLVLDVSKNKTYCYFTIYNYEEGENVVGHELRRPGESISLRIKKGEVFSISTGTVAMRKLPDSKFAP
ncbi:MAG: hypothetical protein GX171_08555 [Clostridiales bacterium]|jgi:hypothetical protein|nr:hypothetical protein [Clostridiales bacterium]